MTVDSSIGYKVAIIDDSILFREIQSLALTRAGLTVDSFERVDEFLGFAKRADVNQYHCLIIDKVFCDERFDALEQKLAKQLRDLDSPAKYRGAVILWSNSQHESHIVHDAGFDLCVPKEVLDVSIIKDVIARRTA